MVVSENMKEMTEVPEHMTKLGTNGYVFYSALRLKCAKMLCLEDSDKQRNTGETFSKNMLDKWKQQQSWEAIFDIKASAPDHTCVSKNQ